MTTTSYQLGSLTVSPGLVLAPMSGVTCRSFRQLIKELNPGAVGLVVTEFISVEALTRNVRRSLDMMRFTEMERPFAIQIFGYDIARMRDAALMAQDAGADIVDINSGCPAPKVVKRGGGCELMRQPDHLAKILEAVRPVIKVPLTLKMRAGWDDNSRNSLEIARICESAGLDAIAIHGRTRTEMYRGEADWDLVWSIRDAVSIPVLGSGDIVDRQSYERRVFRPSNVLDPKQRPALAGALIGRGALANPLVFSEIMGAARVPLRHDHAKALAIMTRYAELLTEEFAPKVRVGKIKQLASQMLKGHPWRKDLLLAPDFSAQAEILRALNAGTFSSPHARQDLRGAASETGSGMDRPTVSDGVQG